jgi:NlpC/P60 family
MTTISQIRESLSKLSQEAKNSNKLEDKNFGRNVDVVKRSVEKISTIPESSRTPGQKAALKALETWVSNPTAYASSANIPAEYGMGRLDPNDDNGNDLKCNRFVANMAASTGTPFPIRGLNPFNRTPISAEDLYTKESVSGMSNIDSKNAKVGDIICFSGHVGIYLGNGVYISARHSNEYTGTQASDGVQVTKVDWSKNPKFRRMDSRQASIDSTTHDQVMTDSKQTTTSASNQGTTLAQRLATVPNAASESSGREIATNTGNSGSSHSAQAADLVKRLNNRNPVGKNNSIAPLLARLQTSNGKLGELTTETAGKNVSTNVQPIANSKEKRKDPPKGIQPTFRTKPIIN